MSLCARLGEEVGVRTAVDEFHPRVVADPQLAHHVEDVALPQLRPHRTALLAAGHTGPGITAPAFDRVVAHRDEIVPEPLAAS